MDRPLRNGEEIEEVLSVCYAGVDFVQECAGDVKLAEQLFYYCDWRDPIKLRVNDKLRQIKNLRLSQEWK